jgi:eukaryotic-like serine/threonine-protein kinase
MSKPINVASRLEICQDAIVSSAGLDHAQMSDLDLIRRRDTFVGRTREMAEICAGIDGAIAGHGSLFTLAGEPGVGKSRFAQEAASHARTQGLRVIWGRCWEHGGAPAYWPWVQVLRGLTKNVEPDQLSNWMGLGAAEIAQIVPELRNQIGGVAELPSASLGQPDKARFRLFDSMIAFFGNAAEARPVLIALDDLHAADPASLLMLVAFSRQVRGMRATVIGTYRALEMKLSPEHAALIAQAEREGTAFPLLGLDEAAIDKFIQTAWGVTANSLLVRRLHDMTEGNPFFLSEVLRHMAAEGRLASDALNVPTRLTIPRGVLEFTRGLIQPLAEDARNVLDLASVIGRDFALKTLEAASETPGEALTELLDQAASLELIHEVHGVAGRYSFRHALIREALYDALPAAKRRRLHHVVAEAIRCLNASGQPFAEIAYHYCQSASPGDGDADAAIEYSRLAARTAEKQLAYEERATHLNNAIEALSLKRSGDDPFQAELLCDLGEAQIKSGDLAEARKTCLRASDIARRANRPELFARAVLTPGRALSLSGVTDHGLVQLLKEARTMLGDTDGPLLAQVLARQGIELYWSEREQAVALCQQAVDMARRLDDPHTSIVALWGRWLSLRNPDSLEQRLADTRDLITIAEDAGERDFALEARYYRIADLLEAGDIEGADVAHREYLTAEAELRDRFKRGLLLAGMRALMDGHLEESLTLAEQAFAAGQLSGRPLAPNSFLIHQTMTFWELGRFGELESTLRGFIVKNPLIVFARCALQLILLQQGRPDDARSEFDRLAENEFRLVQRDWNWLPSMFVLADVCADVGDIERARILFRLLAPFASRNAMLGNVYTFGSVAFALGRLATVLGGFEDAEAHFESALAANRRIRATVWVGHTQCELASLLLTRDAEDDCVRARELIASARQTAHALGLVRLQRKLEFVDVRPKTPQEIMGRRATAFDLMEGAAVAEARFPSAGGTQAEEPGSIEAMVVSAVSRARDLGAQALFEGTATFLFSDIEDSSSLYEVLGDLRAHELIRAHNEIIRQQVAAHRGVEVKAFGDSFMIAFSSARRAALCAIAAQRSFAAYCETHPDQPIRVRMGLHVGEAINESADYFGKAVILTARIATLAHGGQILVSSTFHDLTANAGDLRFSFLGEKQLKGLAGTHQIFEVAW